MTGILITAGENPLQDHERSCSFFVLRKGMRESHREVSEHLCISTFSWNGLDDQGHAAIGDTQVHILGMLVYRGFIGKEALNLFLEDLCRNSPMDLTDHCDGHFCMVIRDAKGFRVMTDHAGIIGMYRYRSGNRLAMSSSSMALSGNYPVTENPRALAQFLRCSSVYGSGTIYNEISLLEPAYIHSFNIDQELISERRERYWHPPIEVREGLSFEESRDGLMHAMLESFRAIPNEGIICDLTAGYDSRLILSLLSVTRPFKDMEIFVFGPPGSKEVRMVGDYCRDLGMAKIHLALPSDWDERIPEYVQKSLYVTDGEENIFVYAPILYAQEFKARSHEFSVNGLGGELYRDFWWIQELYPSKRPARLDRLIEARVLQYEFDHSIFSNAWKGIMSNMKGILKQEFESSIRDMDPQATFNTLQIDNLYYRQKMRRWAGRSISSSNQLIRTLTPLAMKRCIATALSVHPKYKRNGRMVKSIVQEVAPSFSRMKMLSGAPCQIMTLSNAYRFLPLAADYGRRGARKLVQTMLNRTVMLDRTISYQPADFFRALFPRDGFRKAFEYDALLTRKLYHPEKYNVFYQNAINGRSVYHQQLGNILTLELRMRNDNIRHDIE